jgi:hypothetical protein
VAVGRIGYLLVFFVALLARDRHYKADTSFRHFCSVAPAPVAPAVAPTPAPVAYQQQDNVRVEPATQPQPVVQDES